MGGAGKSPLVAHVAARLRAANGNPAILTRGYRRRSEEKVVVPRGGQAAIAVTGDEAQIFIRAGDAHVGIGADRFLVGRSMEQEIHPDVFLLDDGFQHVRLGRTHDVVLIDALDPLAGGPVPLGRLREPLESLARADTIVVTRLELGQETTGLERLLRRYNAQAPVFHSRVVPRQWVNLETGTVQEVSAAKFGRVAAFCGLGVPRSFWRTLEELGLEVAFRWAFGDHHRYRPVELRRLAEQATAAGAEALVTTEKDVMNLCDGAPALVAPHPLLWLKIGIEIEREEEFLRRIL
jgi:tetraacyldisaccharide 4'-kinase